MTFYPHIQMQPLDGLNFEVVEDCFVSEFSIIIQKGSVNDLASVPRWLWWLIPPHGNAKRASIVHDYLMRSGKCEKQYADAVFYYLLKKDVSHWQALTMFLSVVFFKRKKK